MFASRRGLFSLCAGAFLLRLAVVWLSGAYQNPFTYEHGEIAENLLTGRGFSVRFLGGFGSTSQQAPAYPAILAGAYWLFGVRTPAAFLALQTAQALVGAAGVAGAFCLARHIAGASKSAPWLAAAAAAIHPVLLYATMHVQVVVWVAAFLVWLLALATSPRCQAARWGPAATGMVAGVLLLFEPIMALAAPIAALAYYLGARKSCARTPGAGHGPARRWCKAFAFGPLAFGPAGRVAQMALCALLVVTPWIARNYAVHGQFVFVKSTFGYAFWQGNNPASWGTDKIPKPSAEALRTSHDGTLAGMREALDDARGETLYIDDVLLKPHGYLEFAGLSEVQRSQLLGRKAWMFVRSHPERYARLCLRRLWYFMLFDETNPKAAHPVYRLATLLWLATLLAGAAIRWRCWRAWWPLAAVFCAVALFHVLTIVSARFRIPLELLTMPICALGVAELARGAARLSQAVLRPFSRSATSAILASGRTQ